MPSIIVSICMHVCCMCLVRALYRCVRTVHRFIVPFTSSSSHRSIYIFRVPSFHLHLPRPIVLPSTSSSSHRLTGSYAAMSQFQFPVPCVPMSPKERQSQCRYRVSKSQDFSSTLNIHISNTNAIGAARRWIQLTVKDKISDFL